MTKPPVYDAIGQFLVGKTLTCSPKKGTPEGDYLIKSYVMVGDGDDLTLTLEGRGREHKVSLLEHFADLLILN